MLTGPVIIRSEAHALRTCPGMRADVQRTIAVYRRVVRMLATVAMTHWPELGNLDALKKPMALEALVHPTAQRPIVRYAMVSKVLGKMPSYLRRAAVSHALGIVSSYLANYSNWLDDEARARGSRPPLLGFTNVYPSLYGGNMIIVGVLPAARKLAEDVKALKFAKKQESFAANFVGPRLLSGMPTNQDKEAQPAYIWKTQVSKAEDNLAPGLVRIKLLNAHGEWVFTKPLKLQGRRKRLPCDGSMPMSPSLMQRGAKVWLGCPVELKPPRYVSNAEFKKSVDGKAHRVCAIDVGINTAATAAIVDSTGTVIARRFLTCGRHNDQRDRLQAVIRFKQTQSGKAIKGQPFCSELYRRIEGLSKDAARRLASEVSAFAAEYGAKAIVVEDLKGWRPKGPSKAMRQRFHRFQHRMLINALTHKAQELGMRLLEVYARGTSRWAYDGSGKVSRAKENAQNATFSNGRKYNADLNAAYNIAGRGLAMIMGIQNPRKEAETGKRSGSVSRMPIVLADVWAHHKLKSLCSPKPLSGTTNPALVAVVCQQ